MADAKVSALTELTSVATGDLIPIVDISDSTMGASGTTKKITQDNLLDPNLPTASVDNEVALFSSTTGRVLKRASSTGIAKVTSGVLSTITPASGVETFITTPSSANLASAVTDETGSGALVFGTSPTIATPTITTPTIKTYDGWQLVSDSWTYASADAPTYTITVPSGAASLYGVGDKIKLTHSAAVKYFIVTAVADTVLTVYGGTDYTLSASALSSIYYSHDKSPLGFPLDPLKWTVTVTDTTQRTAAGTGGTWLNVGTTNSQIAIPIGVWDVSYQVNAVQDRTTQGTGSFIKVALSDANNTASNLALVSYHRYESGAANSSDINGITMARSKTLTLSVKATYYLNMVSDASGNWTYENALGNSLIEARCSYL